MYLRFIFIIFIFNSSLCFSQDFEEYLLKIGQQSSFANALKYASKNIQVLDSPEKIIQLHNKLFELTKFYSDDISEFYDKFITFFNNHASKNYDNFTEEVFINFLTQLQSDLITDDQLKPIARTIKESLSYQSDPHLKVRLELIQSVMDNIYYIVNSFEEFSKLLQDYNNLEGFIRFFNHYRYRTPHLLKPVSKVIWSLCQNTNDVIFALKNVEYSHFSEDLLKFDYTPKQLKLLIRKTVRSPDDYFPIVDKYENVIKKFSKKDYLEISESFKNFNYMEGLIPYEKFDARVIIEAKKKYYDFYSDLFYRFIDLSDTPTTEDLISFKAFFPLGDIRLQKNIFKYITMDKYKKKFDVLKILLNYDKGLGFEEYSIFLKELYDYQSYLIHENILDKLHPENRGLTEELNNQLRHFIDLLGAGSEQHKDLTIFYLTYIARDLNDTRRRWLLPPIWKEDKKILNLLKEIAERNGEPIDPCNLYLNDY
ncbi:MAG: hypothetical protein H6621_04215 [Halobacteriovoraceae bacterium]|nr:hypothetical protein [Halobacteriovoraceae bacterium]